MRIIDALAKAISEYCDLTNTPALGQNLFKPSYISGLGKDLVQSDGITPKNSDSFDTTNSELTTVGYGIGRMTQGHNTLHVVKQQDFLYLAIDQLINTLCNSIDIPDRELGQYTIICMISDWPFEGVQARSNNIELFASLGNFIQINYCMSPEALKTCLHNGRNGTRLIFMSTEFTYKKSLEGWNWSYINSGEICISFKDEQPKVNILVGFIPEKILRTIVPSNFIAIINITSNTMIKEIINSINANWASHEVVITIYEASTSKISFAYEIGWLLRTKGNFADVQIRHINLGEKNKIGLADQAKY